MTEVSRFNRILLGVQRGVPDQTMRLAAELADLLQIELIGLFLEDDGLRSLARLPFTREFQLLGGGWRPLDLARLSHDLELAAKSAERAFAETARQHQTRYQFKIIQGPITEAIASVSAAGDIVMLAEHPNPAERMTQQFLWLRDAAFQSPAAVMLVPSRVVRKTGPVIAIAAAADDPSIDTAAAIAATAKADLIVIDAFNDAGTDPRPSVDPGRAAKRLALGSAALFDPAGAISALRPTEERLIVMRRGVLDERFASAIAAARHVPVLMIEPRERRANLGRDHGRTEPCP
jgi:hypothetical protein